MGVIKDIIGNITGNFQFGIGGPRIKRNGTALEARNAADNALANLVAAILTANGVSVTGDDLVLNSDASGAGSDRTMTLRRPSAGMSQNIVVVMPANDPAPGQALTVASFAGGVVTLEYSTIAGGTDKVVCDTTSLAFGASSPVAMFTLPANAVVKKVQVIIDTAFNGAPSLSIGISGTTSKYMGSTQVDLTAAAATVFEVDPGLAAVGATESLIATYSAGSASAGAARILVDYVIPS